MTSEKSYRRILETSTIVAGASIIGILGSLLRMKLAAVILGPVGIGLIGLYQNFMATAASISSMGIPTVGARKIAQALSDPDSREMALATKALMVGGVVLACIGMAVVWLFRFELAKHVFGDPGQSQSIGWLALGVALTTYTGAQSAYLNGLQRIGDLARLSIVSGIAATIFGIPVLITLGPSGILLFVLIIPFVNCLAGKWFTSRAKNEKLEKVTAREIRAEWGEMLKLGMAVVFASAIFGIAQLMLRSIVVNNLGVSQLGHFQAAWAISVTYAGLVFQAMGADYFPRLASSNGDPVRQNALVNEQAEIALLLAAPFFILVLSLAPWVIRVAYSSDFSESVNLLRWQVLGDILKVAGWPIGFINLARGDSRTYLTVEIVASATLVFVSWALLHRVGLMAAGIGFFAMNLAYLIVVLVMAYSKTGYAWPQHIRSRFILVLASASAIFLMSWLYPMASLVAGTALACVFGMQSLAALSSMPGIGGPVGTVVSSLRAKLVRRWWR